MRRNYSRNNLTQSTQQLLDEACEKASREHSYCDFNMEYFTGGVVIVAQDLDGNKMTFAGIDYDDHTSQNDIITEFIKNLMHSCVALRDK